MKTKLSFEFLELCSPSDGEPGRRWTLSFPNTLLPLSWKRT